MTTTSPYDIGALIDPWAGGADDDEALDQYEWVDPSDEASIRRVIAQDIVPHVAAWDDARREKVKLALQFALTFGTDWLFQRTFDSDLPPFEAPVPARRLFELIWEIVYGDIDYRLPGVPTDYVDRKTRLKPEHIRLVTEEGGAPAP